MIYCAVLHGKPGSVCLHRPPENVCCGREWCGETSTGEFKWNEIWMAQWLINKCFHNILLNFIFPHAKSPLDKHPQLHTSHCLISLRVCHIWFWNSNDGVTCMCVSVDNSSQHLQHTETRWNSMPNPSEKFVNPAVISLCRCENETN